MNVQVRKSAIRIVRSWSVIGVTIIPVLPEVSLHFAAAESVGPPFLIACDLNWGCL